MDDERKLAQDLYIRVCRDSGWQLDYIEAAKLVARVLNTSPLLIWTKFSSLDLMRQIASGEHPTCHRDA